MSSIRNVSAKTINDIERSFAEGDKLIIFNNDDEKLVFKHPLKKFTLTISKSTATALFQGKHEEYQEFFNLFQTLACANSNPEGSDYLGTQTNPKREIETEGWEEFKKWRANAVQVHSLRFKDFRDDLLLDKNLY